MLNTPYRDTWFMPSSHSYMIRLIEDAGGEYVYTKNDSDASVAVDLEEAYLLGQRRGCLAQRRPLQHPRRTDGSKPQVRRNPRRAESPGLQ